MVANDGRGGHLPNDPERFHNAQRSRLLLLLLWGPCRRGGGGVGVGLVGGYRRGKC